MLIPFADRLQKVNMQIITMPVPAQDGITRDNVTVRVDAVIYFKVDDPVRAAVDVQATCPPSARWRRLRSIIGKSNLDDLLSNRERLNQGLELLIDSPALGWGHIDRVEIKDVVLPDSMKRSIARQAEAERERRARVITAEGELQASEKLAQAAEVMAEHPRRYSFGSWKPSLRSRRRRTPLWYFPSPSNCFGSWNEQRREDPSARMGRRRNPSIPHRLRSAKACNWPHQRSPTMLAAFTSVSRSRARSPGRTFADRRPRRLLTRIHRPFFIHSRGSAAARRPGRVRRRAYRRGHANRIARRPSPAPPRCGHRRRRGRPVRRGARHIAVAVAARCPCDGRSDLAGGHPGRSGARRCRRAGRGRRPRGAGHGVHAGPR
jgi:hypothetical protein